MSNSSFIESVAIEQLNDKAFYIIFRPKEGEEVSSVESVDNQSFEDGYRFFVLNGVFEEEITIRGEIADQLPGCDMFRIADNALLFIAKGSEKTMSCGFTCRKIN